jgi:hypothetical protein
MPTPEGRVKEKIKRILKTHDIWYYMPVSMGMGQHGIPDFLCCVNGMMVGVEAKAGKGKTTGLQDMQLSRMRSAGAFTFIVNEDNLDALNTWLLQAKTKVNKNGDDV